MSKVPTTSIEPVNQETAFEVRSGAVSDRGAVRAQNEDALLAGEAIFLVADGMGGHAGGELASQAVVAAFAEVGGPWVTSQTVCRVLELATESVRALEQDGPPPGSTVVGAALAEQHGVPCWLIFNVGDSRAYRLRGDDLTQVTVDHSRRQQLIETGADAESTARNVITRAIGAGMRGRIGIDQWLLPARQGDRVLLCSDGLSTEVSDQLIAATLLSVEDPQQVAERLVTAALEAGGRDNVTVVVIDAVKVSVPGDNDGLASELETTLSDISEVDESPTLTDPSAFADDLSNTPEVAP